MATPVWLERRSWGDFGICCEGLRRMTVFSNLPVPKQASRPMPERLMSRGPNQPLQLNGLTCLTVHLVLQALISNSQAPR